MSGIYIHIPFCKQACIYCNFYFTTQLNKQSIFIDSLLKEIELRANEFPSTLETIYFGGGTPSFVEPQSIERILLAIKGRFPQANWREITLEANPDDMTDAHLKAWKAIGISRLSVGVQSFHDHHLQWMHRAHSSNAAIEALSKAKTYGFELSLDLIFGIPGSSQAEWQYNLDTALQFDPEHLSCYGLTLEEKTAWFKLLQKGKAPAIDEKASLEQFQLTMSYLAQKGWLQYEISNYAMPGHWAVHNTAYWQSKMYIGLGPSAHSFNGVERSWNVADLKAYSEAIAAGNVPIQREVLSQENQFNEYLMTRLRTIWGADINELKQFNCSMVDFEKQLQKWLNSGHVQMQDQLLTLTKEGKLMADAIAADLFV